MVVCGIYHEGFTEKVLEVCMLETGMVFPHFTLPDENQRVHSLPEYAGKWLVVYFYPKDNTSGCATEAAAFAALHQAFVEQHAVILGVSPDSVASHNKFSCKLALPFLLLSDAEHMLLQACGVWQRKKMAGHEYMGVVRTTALVGPDGIVRAFWPKVKVAGHAEEVLATLRALQG